MQVVEIVKFCIVYSLLEQIFFFAPDVFLTWFTNMIHLCHYVVSVIKMESGFSGTFPKKSD